jgi:RimJ/RimL family protein N-acetyltransferase
LAWHNDAALYETLGGAFRFVSRKAEVEWLRRKSGSAADELNLAICVTRTRRHVGNIYLRGIDWTARHGEAHLFVGAAADRGKGYGASALRQLVAHAFGTLGLQRLFLLVLKGNAVAIRTYASCGFRGEGTLRRHAFKRGRFRDVLVMGLLNTEHRRRKA